LSESTSRSLAKSGWVARGLGVVVRRRRLDVGVSVVGSNGHRGCGFDRSVQTFARGVKRIMVGGSSIWASASIILIIVIA